MYSASSPLSISICCSHTSVTHQSLACVSVRRNLAQYTSLAAPCWSSLEAREIVRAPRVSLQCRRSAVSHRATRSQPPLVVPCHEQHRRSRPVVAAQHHLRLECDAMLRSTDVGLRGVASSGSSLLNHAPRRGGHSHGVVVRLPSHIGVAMSPSLLSI